MAGMGQEDLPGLEPKEVPGTRPPVGIMLFIHLASAGWLNRRKVDWPRHSMQPVGKANTMCEPPPVS